MARTILFCPGLGPAPFAATQASVDMTTYFGAAGLASAATGCPAVRRSSVTDLLKGDAPVFWTVEKT